MAEGWLFRLRTSLGSQYTAPAWPSVRGEETDKSAASGLRRPTPERPDDERDGVIESSVSPRDPRKSGG